MTVRRGSAPLELVLTAPLLVGAVVWVAGLGATGVARTAAVSEARSAAWAAPTASSEPLRLDHPLDDGRVARRGSRPVAGPWRAGPAVEAAEASVVGGTWAADELAFSELLPTVVEPHLTLLGELARRNPSSFGGTTVEGLAAARRLDPAAAGVSPPPGGRLSVTVPGDDTGPASGVLNRGRDAARWLRVALAGDPGAGERGG